MNRTVLLCLLLCVPVQAAMHGFLKQSTSATVLFGPIVDGTDGKTAETTLTLHAAHIELSKNGGAFAAKNDSTNPTHRSRGQYVVTLNATDTATLGVLTVDWVDANDVLIIPQTYQIVTASWYESMSGSGSSDPWATALPGAYTAGQAGYIVGTNVDTTISSRATTAALASVEVNLTEIIEVIQELFRQYLLGVSTRRPTEQRYGR